MEKEFKYFCDNCNYRKASPKTPDQFKRCPYCGQENCFKIDSTTTDRLVQDAVYKKD
jgi:hypothetical protein